MLKNFILSKKVLLILLISSIALLLIIYKFAFPSKSNIKIKADSNNLSLPQNSPISDTMDQKLSLSPKSTVSKSPSSKPTSTATNKTVTNRTTPSQQTQMNILIPAYFYPGNEWNRLIKTTSLYPNRIFATVNISNGPGQTVDAIYKKTLLDFTNASGKYFGYVSTQYGKRDIRTVKSDIDKWYNFYNPNGIFLDEQSNARGCENYYQEVYNYIKSKNIQSTVVGNSGCSTIESYLLNNGSRVTDVICVFESNQNYASWTTASWCFKYSKNNFYVLPYNTSSANYRNYVDKAYANNIGWIYCTDGSAPNPWNTLPSYLNDFCQYVISGK